MSEDSPLPRDREQSPTPPSDPATPANAPLADTDRIPAPRTSARGVEPRRLSPLLPRRQTPRLLVEVDGSPASQGALVWALREAARREGTVVAVSVLDDPADAALGARPTRRDHAAVLERVEAQVLRAIAETGVQGRARISVLDRAVFEVLTAAAHGADLVLVSPESKTLLRAAVPRHAGRRLARGA
jgi:nucleotide-binding universal stress UspA family protein